MSTPVGYDVYAGTDYKYLGRVKSLSDVNLLWALYGQIGFKVHREVMRKVWDVAAHRLIYEDGTPVKTRRRPALIHKGGKP